MGMFIVFGTNVVRVCTLSGDSYIQVTPKTVEELTTLHFDRPRVRSVAEILEETRVTIEPRIADY